ncbi:MAG: hypothetical protein K6D38_03640 [Pseudobutyrivibrio sp.]|nr:hypothetical protein [Pseudobutyrivibrio sp.]
MDENGKRNQREIAKDKVQIILASIALAVLIIIELYVMINFKSNFMALAIGTLLMIVALFFLISALMDISLKTKETEEQKYEEIYNAQKASYLVIKKSFDEMEQRLRAIEENSALPAEDIINAQKAVAKVTISRSKENTDALMNSNDELINQLVSIQEKLDTNNNEMMEKQQSMLKETNNDIQQKIEALTSQLLNIEGRIQSGVPVMAAQPVSPVVEQPSNVEVPNIATEPSVEVPVAEEIGLDVDAVAEEPAAEAVEDLGLNLDAIVEEPAVEAPAAEDMMATDAEDEIGIDLDTVAEEPAAEEAVEDLGLDLDAIVEEPAVEATVEEMVATGAADEVGLDLDSLTEEPVVEEAGQEAELDIDSLVPEMEEEAPVEETADAAEPVAEEPASEGDSGDSGIVDLGVDLDALLEEIGEIPGEEPVEEGELPIEEAATEEATAEAAAEEPAPAAESEEKPGDIVIPDVGVDLTDPNRVMSAEEIEKLFANI